MKTIILIMGVMVGIGVAFFLIIRLIDFIIETRHKTRNEQRSVSILEDSMTRLANEMGCDVHNAKKTYLEILKEKEYSKFELHELHTSLFYEACAQGREWKCGRKYTPSGILEKWITEFEENGLLQPSKLTENDVRLNILMENPEFAEIVSSGDQAQLKDYLVKNPDFTQKVFEDFVYKDNPEQRFKDKAKIYDRKAEIYYIFGKEMDADQARKKAAELRSKF